MVLRGVVGLHLDQVSIGDVATVLLSSLGLLQTRAGALTFSLPSYRGYSGCTTSTFTPTLTIRRVVLNDSWPSRQHGALATPA